MSKLSLNIEGMTCQNCVRHVKEALEELPGVNDVQVNLEENNALVEGNDLSEAALSEAVSEAGYDVTGVTAL